MVIEVGTALTALSFAFGIWAWVVAWGVKVIRNEMTLLRRASQETSRSLEAHILATERRLTMLETEFGFIRRYLSKDPDQSESS